MNMKVHFLSTNGLHRGDTTRMRERFDIENTCVENVWRLDPSHVNEVSTVREVFIFSESFSYLTLSNSGGIVCSVDLPFSFL